MVSLQEVETQLDSIGANYKFWGRAEILELQHILVPGERIQACLNGHYSGGFATFVATDQRLLIVDKKVFFLTVEDMRYDMISEVDFGAQLLSGTIRVCTPTKTLIFTNYKPKILRQLASYIQQRVMQVRHQYMEQSGEVQHNPLPVVSKPANLESLVTPQVDEPAQQPIPAAPSPASYQQALGVQALNGSDQASFAADGLPAPLRRNPYMNPPLMMRRRVGRFGPIGTLPTPQA
jgi:Bacterial PH domain